MELAYMIAVAITIILGTFLFVVFGLFFGLLFKGVDRKLSAHMQGRIGPPIRQPFRDVRKLFTKENIVPENAIPWVFHLAPLIGLIATLSILLFLPIGGFQPLLDSTIIITGQELTLLFGDLILILYLLMIPSLAMVIGGFASGSPYATVGAQREMATMIAYEFPLAIIIVTIAWKIGSTTTGGAGIENAFTFSAITSTPIWNIVGPIGFLGLILLLLVLILVTPAELSKIPFDAPEAETEIAGGLLTEYSGRNLGMFYLTDCVKTLVMASLIVALFFSYNLSDLQIFSGFPDYAVIIIDFLFFLLKVVLVVLFSVTLIRVAIARLKIDQIVYTYWVPLTLLALVGLILIMWDGYTMEQFSWQPLLQMLGIG
jgi:formate hydrogenlyase subunit 4